MATEKQVRMMLGKAAEAGMKLERGDVVDLDNGGIDQMLERIKVSVVGKDKPNVSNLGPVFKSLNDMRFGMCCKLVVQQLTLDYCLSRPDLFSDRVISLYKLVGQTAEAAMHQIRFEKDDSDKNK